MPSNTDGEKRDGGKAKRCCKKQWRKILDN